MLRAVNRRSFYTILIWRRHESKAHPGVCKSFRNCHVWMWRGGEDHEVSKVTYTQSVAAGTVEDYTNADWLYQNYFGDYGLPEEVKPNFIPALQMLANGFMLQLKSGKDVKKNIEEVHSLFLQYSASDHAQKFFIQAQNFDINSENLAINSNDGYQNNEYTAPPIAEEDLVAINKAKSQDIEAALAIKRTAEEYELPYKITAHDEQWFIFSPAMKGGGKGSGTNNSTPSQPKKSHQNIEKWGWRPGDMIWVNGQGSITGVPGHVAIVWPYTNGLQLVDANTDVGVSRHDNAQTWMDRYTEVRALSPRLNWSWSEYDCHYWYGSNYDCKPDSWIRANSFYYSERKIGAGYNWNFANPRNESTFYCSSLLWNAYNHVEYNIIFPSNLGFYGIVTPAQIRDSKSITTFKISTL